MRRFVVTVILLVLLLIVFAGLNFGYEFMIARFGLWFAVQVSLLTLVGVGYLIWKEIGK